MTRPDIDRRDALRPWVVVALATLPYLVIRAGTLAESDTFWETRAGLLMLHTHALPRADPFSWTMFGRPWTLASWAFDVVVGVAYRAGGLPTVALVCAALVFLVIALVLRTARRLGASVGVTALVLLVVLSLLTPFASARPQVVDFAAVLVVAELLHQVVVGRDARRSIVFLGVTSVVWVNLHTAALLGVGIGGVTTVLVLARRQTRSRTAACAAATVALGIGSLLNPYGFGVVHTALSAQSGSSKVITEWRHLDPTSPLLMAVFCLGLVALWCAVRRRDVVFTAAIAVALVGSISAIRMIPIVLVLSGPVLAAALSHGRVDAYLRSRRTLMLLGATALVVVLAGDAALAARHLGRPDPETYPTKALSAFPPGCRTVNTFVQGGLIILKRPDVLVSIDSYLYDEAGIVANVRLLAAKGDVNAGLRGAGCALVPPESGLAHKLASDPGWRQVTAERTAVLFVRG